MNLSLLSLSVCYGICKVYVFSTKSMQYMQHFLFFFFGFATVIAQLYAAFSVFFFWCWDYYVENQHTNRTLQEKKSMFFGSFYVYFTFMLWNLLYKYSQFSFISTFLLKYTHTLYNKICMHVGNILKYEN